MARMQNLLFVLVLSAGVYYACGHVALTFPPARQYDLDFLDNSRTPAPCGMPKGRKLIFFLFLFAFFLRVNKFYLFTVLLDFKKHHQKEFEERH